MGVLDIFALLVILLLIGVVIWLVVLLGSMPGDIARKRNHPQADAITALGWIGIITLGPAWLAALVWAYTKPHRAPDLGTSDLKARVEALEERVRRSESPGEGGAR